MKRRLLWTDWAFAAALALITLAVYAPALHAGFIWDDEGHVTPHELQSLAGLRNIWFQLGASQQYYPVLHSAFWIEHRLWGQSTFCYHLLNIGWHVLAALLLARVVYVVLDPARPAGFRRTAAYLAAALFALHPVEVETVAWISEQKNTLSAVFYLFATLAYLRFDERRTWGWYALSFGGFILALLSKSVTATLPAALLVILWYRKGRLEFRRDWVPLLPWFPFSAAMAMVTGYVEKTYIGAVGPTYALQFSQRIALSGRIFWFYVGKFFWPTKLSFNYERWTIDAHQLIQFTGVVGAILLVAGLWALRRRSRAPLAAALFFGGTLFPALGFVNVYPFAFSYVADHFQYLAGVGLCAAIAAAAVTLAAKSPPARWLVGLVAAGILATFAFLSHSQARIYRDPETLYRATLELNPHSGLAWNNLGLLIYTQGDVFTAIADYKKALENSPHMVEARNDLGIALADLGKWQAAIQEFAAALKDKNPFPQAEINVARPLIALGRFDEAAGVLHHALQFVPNEPAAHLALGRTLSAQGHYEEAVKEFDLSLSEQSDIPGTWNFRGDSLRHLGRNDEAIRDFAEALRLRPKYADAEYNWAMALVAKNQIHDAVARLIEANRQDPNRPDIYLAIADLMQRSGHPADAERFTKMAQTAAANAAKQADATR